MLAFGSEQLLLYLDPQSVTEPQCRGQILRDLEQRREQCWCAALCVLSLVGIYCAESRLPGVALELHVLLAGGSELG